jgi:hypothetical protein
MRRAPRPLNRKDVWAERRVGTAIKPSGGRAARSSAGYAAGAAADEVLRITVRGQVKPCP